LRPVNHAHHGRGEKVENIGSQRGIIICHSSTAISSPVRDALFKAPRCSAHGHGLEDRSPTSGVKGVFFAAVQAHHLLLHQALKSRWSGCGQSGRAPKLHNPLAG
jgi:hypothetical protein